MSKYDLFFSPPYMNAAGSLGFAPDLRGPLDLAQFGAFVTHPLSLGPRTPAQGQRWAGFPGGFLLHTGYPNPGLSAAIRRYAGYWARSPLPILVSLLPQDPGEAAAMMERLEGLPGVMGLEVSLPPAVQPEEAAALVAASSGELPVVARLPLEQALLLAPAVLAAGAAAVSLGPPRGALPGPQGRLVHGRLYGPALFPQALSTVRSLTAAGHPVIAAGGIYNPEAAAAMLAAGALALQLDTVLWRSGINLSV